ncbi:MAG: antibiotic biosynthesis monooxygenase [Acidobacteria bacterium]|nr:antibiotic biosynthesis monooxygenase [Acidobacteriota bacterium]
MAKRVTAVARVRARAGAEERVKRACLALVAPSRGEAGCLNYDLHQSADDPALFLFYENWESREDLERHLESKHSVQFDESTAGLLAEPEEVTFWEKLG